MFQYRADQLFSRNESITIQKTRTSGTEAVHTHDFIEIVYVLSGDGQQSVNGLCYPIQKGTLLFINYGQTHAFSTKTSIEYYNILLKPEFISMELINSENAFELLALTAFEEFRSLNPTTPFVSFSGKELLEIEGITDAMHREFKAKQTGYQSILKGYMQVFLVHILHRMQLANESSPVSSSPLTPDLLAYIEEHCSEKITLPELAEQCFYNPSYFSRVFKEYSGMSLTDFIQRKRIEKACRLLQDTDWPIETIATDVGYGDKTQFYRQFKSYMGATPNQFRRRGS